MPLLPHALLRSALAALALLALVAHVLPNPAREDDGIVSPEALSSFLVANNLSASLSNAGERICLAGQCSCFDEPYQSQCYAEERANYLKNFPARGDITGVCYGYWHRWVDNGRAGKTQERRGGIFSKVKFKETITISGDNRNPQYEGFEAEVRPAWDKFAVNETGSKPADGERWTWSGACVSMNSPRHSEDQDWLKLQSQQTFARVFLPGFGVADTPEERAAEAKANAERAARAAEEKRIADAKAAEEARRVAAAEALRRQKVKAIEQQIGPGKAAAAQRLNELNQQTAQYRPKPAPTPSAAPTKPAKPRQCTRRTGTQVASHTSSTREQAEAGVMRSRGIPGGSESIVSSSVSAATCSERAQLHIKPPPVGTCLSCIDEKMAINLYGYVPGKGYPPPKSEWICKATVTYVAERCGDGSSKVSSQ